MKGCEFMAIPESVLRDWEALTEEGQRKAQHYIRLLSLERSMNRQDTRRDEFPFGVWNGGLKYMADDFNETPEGFEEYV